MRYAAGMDRYEAAKYLGIPLRTLERYMQQGKVGFCHEKGKTRSVVRFDQAELERFKLELEAKLYKPSVVNPDNGAEVLAILSDQLLKSDEIARFFEVLETIAEYQNRHALVPTQHKLLLTLKEVQALTGLSRVMLRNAINAGALKAERIGRAWRIKRADVEKYVEKLF